MLQTDIIRVPQSKKKYCAHNIYVEVNGCADLNLHLQKCILAAFKKQYLCS